MVTRQQILEKVNTFDIFKHFLREYYDKENAPIKPGVYIYVPEISGEQNTPSFNLYYSHRSSEYRYKDFTGNDGSAFDLVMNLCNTSFVESLKIINSEMNLGLEDSHKYELKKVKPKPKKETIVQPKHNTSYELEIYKWSKKYLKFWTSYGTGLKTLNKYGYKPLKQLFAYKKDNSSYEIKSASDSLIFVFERNGWGKYYMPEIKGVQKKRFGYFGDKPSDYVFGLEQLPESGDDLYLVAGEKDCLSMHSHGKWAVALTSEESNPGNYPDFIKLIRSDRFKNKYIMYDRDDTGEKQMKKISKEYPELKPKILDIPKGWDVSDFLKDKYNKLMF